MAKTASQVLVGLITALVYLVYTGAYSITELMLAFVSGFLIARVLGIDLVGRTGFDLFKRFAYFIAYVFKYFTVIEARAHFSVVKAILSPKPRLSPGIVRVPYEVRSEYSVVGIANSITNTPGTVVVDVDEVNKKMYVHWLFAKPVSDEEARRYVSWEFEKWMKKIFG